MEPEAKRPRVKDEVQEQPLCDTVSNGNQNGAQQNGTRVNNINLPSILPLNGSKSQERTQESPRNELEVMRQTVEKLRREVERRENENVDISKKLEDATNMLQVQKEEIRGLRLRLGENLPPPPATPSLPMGDKVNEVAEALSTIGEEFGHRVTLQILQHPPTQAVYQRILRPFPTVAVLGASHLKTTSNLFVEVSLLRQHEQHSPQPLLEGKASEKKSLIGGQLVQRSEWGPNPDKLIVVFRKLKILTTTAQQGGSFFVLKFILKRYVDNNFEVVPGVTLAISDPMEVFSHTLYLKSRAPGQQINPSPPFPFTPHTLDEKSQPKRAASPPLPQSRDKDRPTAMRNRSISLPPGLGVQPPARMWPNAPTLIGSLTNPVGMPTVSHPMEVEGYDSDDAEDSLESQARILQLLRKSAAK